MEKEKKKAGKKKKIIIGIIVIFVLFIIICCLAGSDDSEETMESNSQTGAAQEVRERMEGYCDSIKEFDLDGTGKYLASEPDYWVNMNENVLNTFRDIFKEGTSNLEYTIGDIEVDEEQEIFSWADVTVRFRFLDYSKVMSASLEHLENELGTDDALSDLSDEEIYHRLYEIFVEERKAADDSWNEIEVDFLFAKNRNKSKPVWYLDHIPEDISKIITCNTESSFEMFEKKEAEDIETETSDNASPQITTPEEAREYMESCSWSPNYSDIMRYEDDYVGKNFAFFAKVSQVLTDGSLVVYDDANGDGYYTDNQYCIMDRRSLETTKILEDDMITIYGRYVGVMEMERAIGSSIISIPGFNMYLCDVEDVELKANRDVATDMDYSLYGKIIHSGEGSMYTLYDIDGDGIKELITSGGNSNADWQQNVYTMDIYGRISSIGTFGNTVELYVAEDGNGIYSVYGRQGLQTVERITKEGGALHSIIVMEGEAEEYYENDNPIPWNDVSDLSLLE